MTSERKIDPEAADGAGNQSLWSWLRSQFNPRPPDDDQPQDWWIASTAIPLVAATTGPLANVMSITALVQPWRSTIHHDQRDSLGRTLEVGLDDPRWTIALNATSLACGVAGNVFLMFNFTRTIRYIIALPASIILWTLATAILIGITASMHVFASPIGPDQIYSQAYWSAVIAAVLYFILSVILMINMLGYVLGHYPQHFALTDHQRTLILQTSALVTWLLIGAAIFHRVIDISFADALYFSDVTILTLGYGDIIAQSNVAKGLVFPYAVMGIIILGLVVESIHKFARQLQYTNVVRKHAERKRQATVSRSDSAQLALDEKMQGREIQIGASNITPLVQRQSTLSFQPKNKPRKHRIRNSISYLTHGGPLRSQDTKPELVIMKEEKDRFDAMRAIQRDTVRFRRYYNLIISVLIFGIVWTCGAVIFWRIETGLTYFESLYWGFCSLLTIGYGDITPQSNAGKPFFVVWSLVAIPTMTTLISEMSDTIVLAFKHATDVAADWTVLPHKEKYRAFLQRFPTLYNALLHREEKKRVARGFGVGYISDDEESRPGCHQQRAPQTTTVSTITAPPPQQKQQQQAESQSQTHHPLSSMIELARPPGPSTTQLAQQLAFAIQRTTRDALAQDSEPKQYSYEEWVQFTRLIRFTDPRYTSSCSSRTDPAATATGGTGTGTGAGTSESGSRESDTTVLYEDEYGVLNWDWIGETSPMLAAQTEPEWVLDRLCESLVRYVDIRGKRKRMELGKEKTIEEEDEDEATLRKEREVMFET